MSDPLQESAYCSNAVVTSHITSLKFAKLHSPKMKSVYWRHFGYPTNEDNCIITKQNVVCILCHKVLTNHGNTTNLRAHLQYRHKDVFQKIIAENGIKVPPRKIHTKYPSNVSIKSEPCETKVKIEYSESSQDASSTGVTLEDQSMLYESVVPMTYEDDEIIDSNQFTKIEVMGGGQIKTTSVNFECDSAVHDRSMKQLRNEIDPSQLLESLVSLVVEDISSIDSINEPGITLLINTLCPNLALPSSERVELLIREMYNEKHTAIASHFKMHSQYKPYSLGFEIWTNVEQKQFLSIYFNYITDDPDYNLVNKLLYTIEYNKYTSLENVLEEFNLQNCTAVIANCDCEENMKQFLDSKNVPVILAYDVVVNYCLKSVFELRAVSAIVEEIRDVTMRFSEEIRLKDLEVPALHDDFPWTYFELLKFFCESVSWPEEIEVLVTSSKAIIEIINTLSFTLDTLRGEEILLSSMLAPITAKVLNNKLTVGENDDEFVATIKTAIADILEKLVMSDDQLILSALLDPRFHRLITINNLNKYVQILSDNFHRISEYQGFQEIVSCIEDNRPKSTTNLKKSNLELFFDLAENSAEQSTGEQNNIEADLRRYRTEVFVSLDESPFVWWARVGNIYGSLKPLAAIYQCVPCTVNMDSRKSLKQQILTHHKRFLLTGHLVDAILFLHYNK